MGKIFFLDSSAVRLSKMTKKEEKMVPVKLSSVIWRRFGEERDGIRWKGKFKTTKAEKDSVSMFLFAITVTSVTVGLQLIYTSTRSTCCTMMMRMRGFRLVLTAMT